MHETTTAAPLISWSRAFPATPEQVREARQFLAVSAIMKLRSEGRAAIT